MSVEKPTRYVILGAGAIGIAVGGLLARAGSQVICVVRPAYRDALGRGVTIKQDDEKIIARLDAVTRVSDLRPESGDCIIITPKSQATETAVRELAEVYDANVPVVCLQNGVRNEEIAA